MNDFKTTIITRNPKELDNRLLNLKNRKLFCDIEIVVGNKRFDAHKNVLASSSEYFETEFIRMGSIEKEISLEDVEPEIFQLLLEYCYTGIIEVTENNVKEIMKMANLLIMTPIIEGCANMLEKIMNTSNCISIWKLTRLEYFENLKDIAFEMIKKDFEKVSQFPEFLNLDSSEILELLKADINVSSETIVFHFVMKWIGHDSYSRNKYVDKLSDCIRFEWLPKNTLLSECRALCSYNSSSDCYAKVLNALEQKDKKKFESADKNLRNSYRTLIAVGSEYISKLRTMEIFDLRKEEWIKVENFDGGKTIFSMVLLEEKLMLIGGSMDSIAVNTVQSYDFNTGTIEDLPPMKYARMRLSTVEFKGRVYAIGGQDQTYLPYVEMWDPVLKLWNELTPMTIPRNGCKARVIDDEIFVVGGFNGNYLSDTESYNPVTDIWKRRASMNEKRYAPGVAFVNGFLYAVGGIAAVGVYTTTAERYNPKIDKWTMIHSLEIPKCWMGAGKLMGKFVIVGGKTTKNLNLSTMEMYDDKNDSWISMPSLNEPRYMLKMVEIPWKLAKAVLSK